MKRNVLLALAVLGFFLLSAVSATPEQDKTKWTKSGTKIVLNGNEKDGFIVKGVVYSPCPIGGSADYAPFQDYYHPNYKNAYDIDIPQIRDMGANVVKTYAWWGYLPTIGVEWPGAPNNIKKNVDKELNWSVGATGTLDHKEFLDQLWNGGNNPIYILIGIAIDSGNTWSNANPDKYAGKEAYFKFYKDTAVWAAEKYSSHPAVMGFILGNEMNNPTLLKDKNFWDKFNEMAAAVKEKAPDKLVTVAWQDDPNIFTGAYPELDNNTNFDIWCVNVFSATNFDAFWKRYKTYADNEVNGRPVLITEFGAPVGKHSPADEPGPPNGKAKVTECVEINKKVADLIEGNWKSIANPPEEYKGIPSGGCVFEWTDEWHKVHPTDFDPSRTDTDKAPRTWLHDAANGTKIGDEYPNPWWEEEWWGLNSVAVAEGRDPKKPTNDQGVYEKPDVRTPRAAYHTLKGLWTDGFVQKPRPVIRARSDPETVSSSGSADPNGPWKETHALYLSMNPGHFEGAVAEWFLIHISPSFLYQYDLDLGWVSTNGITPTLTDNLIPFSELKVPLLDLEAGVHVFVFGVDMEVNQQQDDSHWYSSASVLVK